MLITLHKPDGTPIEIDTLDIASVQFISACHNCQFNKNKNENACVLMEDGSGDACRNGFAVRETVDEIRAMISYMTFGYVGGRFNENSTTIDFPMSAQIGDFAVMIDFARNNSGVVPNKVLLPGFTEIFSDDFPRTNTNRQRTTVSWKILTAAEMGGVDFTSQAGNLSTVATLTFRPSRPITRVQTSKWAFQAASGGVFPAPQDINAPPTFDGGTLKLAALWAPQGYASIWSRLSGFEGWFWNQGETANFLYDQISAGFMPLPITVIDDPGDPSTIVEAINSAMLTSGWIVVK